MLKRIELLLLDAFALLKATISFTMSALRPSGRLSVRMELFDSQWTDFHNYF